MITCTAKKKTVLSISNGKMRHLPQLSSFETNVTRQREYAESSVYPRPEYTVSPEYTSSHVYTPRLYNTPPA